ncbi:3'-5' exonuclease [Neptuniibacter halophilus]|uniref:3'-5' exonuclease n=1 Tax=Neptuniibacter halophilus TaxID=651666 RepID=UPI00257408CE|nr:3'-5' exonuclease [Neptuniibacter halophilus]
MSVNLSDAMDWQAFFRDQALVCDDDRLRLFYETGCVAPQTPLSETPFIALDFETTGLDADKDEIISIGAVPFDLNRIRVREARHWLLKPRRKLTEESVVIHGITHSAINEAPDLESVLGSLLEAIAGRVVVVHYRYIEREFLDAGLQRRLGEGIRFPLVDTMELEALLHRKGFSKFCNRVLGRKLTSIRLADSRSRYSLPHYAQHDALVDAIATAELLQAQIRHRYRPHTPISYLWL